MIRHCVFINFRPEIGASQRAEIFQAIDALRHHIPGTLSVHAGGNVSPEGLDKGFSQGFVIDFADAAARDRYLADPEHAKAGKRIVEAAMAGLDGVFVFDLEIAER